MAGCKGNVGMRKGVDEELERQLLDMIVTLCRVEFVVEKRRDYER